MESARRQPTVVMLGTFGLRPKGTMSARALPLAQELTARGWGVRLVLPPWDWPADAGRCSRVSQVGIVNVGLRGGPAAVVRRMVVAAREIEPSIVHLFKPKGYGGLAAARLRLAGARLVVDCDDWEGPGGWNDRVAHYTAAQRLLFAWQATALPRSAHAVTVASRALEAHVGRLGLSPSRVRYVPNGLSRFRHGAWRARAQPAEEPAAADNGENPVLALYTRFDVFAPGRLVALIDAIRVRLPRARVLIVGQGLAREDEQVRAAARAAGLADAFMWAGFVPFEELPAVLGQASLALYPIDDTLINRAKAPMKLLEVLALGLPVVAEAVGETREYVEHGVSGYLTPAGEHEAFAAAVARLVERPALRAAFATAAREHTWRRFAWERLVEGVEISYGAARSGRGPVVDA